jgi:hypothetical protein
MRAERQSLVAFGFGLLSFAVRVILTSSQARKEGRAMMTFFRHYRQCGPISALQMRLQG